MLGDSLQNIKSQWKKGGGAAGGRCGAVGLCVLWWWDGGEGRSTKKLPVFGLFFPV